jgi:cation diffusion facilitator CzcD-associated flavoprotein CzcO
MIKAVLPAETDIAIVGAGFGGLGAAIELDRNGFGDYVVLERSGDVGGTWSANTYPGCQCDVPSNLYSFSFAPKPDWTHSYPEQPQILEYLHDCAERFGVMPKVQLNCELLGAEWVPDERRWQIETSDGTLSARVLIAAPGLLSEPRIPDIPGLDRFKGATFHSARWDHSYDLDGKRVAVMGTGASAIQIVPRIQPQVEQLYVLQRTPPWVLPHNDREIGPALKAIYRRFPPAQRLARESVYWMRELLCAGFVAFRPLLKIVEAMARRQIRKQIDDPELRERVTPDYAVGCKRLLPSESWYPALQEPNAELVTAGVAEIGEHSIAFADGSEREVDAIVFATGFSPTDPPLARRIRRRDGESLSEAWAQSMRAYLGSTVAGFPNLFFLWGPNTNLAHSSVVFMAESQLSYVIDALKTMRRDGSAAVEVRREVQDAWNAEIQEKLAGTVWNTGGCVNWYMDRNGDNPIMWPGFTFTFRRLTRRFDPAAHIALSPAGRASLEPEAV